MTATDHGAREERHVTAIDDYQITMVTSLLVEPDGTPVRGRMVQAIIRADAAWLADGSGRVVSEARTVTDDQGRWSLALTPWQAMEHGEHIYYEIREGDVVHWTHIPASDTPLTLRQVVVNPPPPPDKQPIISSLGTLRNVDPKADRPPAGVLCTLTSEGGPWGMYRLAWAELPDVDGSTLIGANVGDHVIYLGDGKIGVDRSVPPPTLTLTAARAPGVDPMATRFTVAHRTPGRDVLLYPDDPHDPGPFTLPDGTDIHDHTYVDIGDYGPYLTYEDGSNLTGITITVPWEDQ